MIIPYMIEVNIREGYQQYIWYPNGQSLDLVGVLRGRDGEDLYLFTDNLVEMYGQIDTEDDVPKAVVAGRIDVPTKESPVIQSIKVSSDNIGSTSRVAVNGALSEVTTPRKDDDVIIGTETWASGAETYSGREMRTVTHHLAGNRLTDLHLEIEITGADKLLEAVEVETQGQAPRRTDRR